MSLAFGTLARKFPKEDMYTITTLVAAHSRNPGDLKIIQAAISDTQWFAPYYCLNMIWYGQGPTGPAQFSIGTTGWTVYKSDKKIRRAQYAFRAGSGANVWKASKTFFPDEHAARSALGDPVIKLQWTEMEFPS